MYAIAGLIVIVLGLVAPPQTTGQPAQTEPSGVQSSVDYDSFMQKSVQERLIAFNELADEDQASLVRTHIKRWLEENIGRLSEKQITVLKEWIAFVAPENYRQPRPKEVVKRQEELEDKTATLFTNRESVQALTIQGEYVPPRKKK